MSVSTPAITMTPEHFETIYTEAQGDRARISWDDKRPSPALVTWLNRVAPSLIRCGARVAVVGCGLGDDARELLRRGYDVIAFDCSATAVRWARSLDPANAECYVEADLFNPPDRWRHRFDLVVEINTIQALEPERKQDSIRAVGELVSPRGYLLVICRGAAEPVSLSDGPPWALTTEELAETASLAGLRTEGGLCCFDDDETPPVTRIRGLFRRA